MLGVSLYLYMKKADEATKAAAEADTEKQQTEQDKTAVERKNATF